ncbi:TPA: DUF2919 family protein [Escherichia coli]|nr:DUF2919 family protein [Escherichia coli]MED9233579.1 DUF2919 family protein [Escherichia coli]MED9293494.1 DUF2919 family protein [Escherichia coli]HAX9857842.1 DUF2919 domain-containing protein [Escherichia coli]HAX9867521.1 DUF2919 domain-containing protein [Escherichia coli]
MKTWRVEDFDDHGNLRIRKGAWWALFLLAHPWWLVAVEMSIEKGEGRILPAIYPTAELLYAGLSCSAVVFLFLFVCPFRHTAPRLMAVSYVLVMLVCLLMLIRVCIELSQSAGTNEEELWLSLFFLTLGCMAEFWPDERNRETYYLGIQERGA